MKKFLLVLVVLVVRVHAITISQTVVNPAPREGSTGTSYNVRLKVTGYNELTPSDPITPEIVGPATIAPGDSHTFSYNYDQHDPVTDEVHYRSITTEVFRGGVWEEVGNSRVAGGSGGVWESIDAIVNPGSDVESSVEITPSAEPNSTPEDAKTVWLVADTSLTANLFREGVDKIVYAASGGTGGGGGGGSGNTEEQNTYFAQQARLTVQSNAYADGSTLYAETGAAAQGAAKKLLVEEAFNGRDLPSLGAATVTESPMVLHLPMAFAGISEINFDPLANEKVAALCEFMRKVITWSLFVGFQFWVWNYLTGSYRTLSLTQPAKGNPVMGGTGAQATSLLVATLITGVIVSFPSAFWALVDSGWVLSETPINPMEAAAEGPAFIKVAGYLVACFFPMQSFLIMLTSVLLIYKFGLALLAGVQTLVRYFVA